jgi:LysR family transcriptional regulator for metE and metH
MRPGARRAETLPLDRSGAANPPPIAELVKAGLGVSVLARWAVQPLVDAGSIVSRPLTARGLRREWRAVMPKDLAGVDYIGEFIELLGKHAPTARASRKPA